MTNLIKGIEIRKKIIYERNVTYEYIENKIDN